MNLGRDSVHHRAFFHHRRAAMRCIIAPERSWPDELRAD